MLSNSQSREQRRAVVTGMGIVTTIGENIFEYLDAIVAGRSGITYWKNKDLRLYSKFGGDMSDFNFQTHCERVGKKYPLDLVERSRKLLRPTSLSGCLTVTAALQAFVDAGFPDSRISSERFGHILGGNNLNNSYIFDNALQFDEEPDFIDPLYGVIALDTDVLAVTSDLLNLKGCNFTVGGACASSNLALLSGLDLIRSGRVDSVLISGGSMELSPTWLQGWTLLDAISFHSFNDCPTQASRPFEVRREGFVPSEGTGALIVETLESACNRGARIYAELLGASSTSNASRLTKPNIDAQARAMSYALKDAGVEPGQVNYINAHATSTPLGDASEVTAIKKVFKDHAYKIPVNSTKSMIGHCLSASSIIEMITTILQMENSVVHPTINLEEQDPELDLDFVPSQAREHDIKIAISNSFGFGGLNSSVVIGKYN